MNCKDSAQWISDWLDGALTPLEERMLMAHLEQCPECGMLWEQLTALHSSMDDLPELSAPEGFAQGVMSRIHAEGAAQPRTEQDTGKKVVPLFRRVQVRGIAAAAACFVLGFGISRSGFFGGFGAGMPEATTPEAAMVETATEGAPMEWESDTADTSELALTAPGSAGTYHKDASMSQTTAAVEEPQAMMVEPEAALEENRATVTAVTLERLPEGGEDILDGLDWVYGEPVALSEEQAKRLLKLAEEQGISGYLEARTGQTEDGWELVILNEE